MLYNIQYILHVPAADAILAFGSCVDNTSLLFEYPVGKSHVYFFIHHNSSLHVNCNKIHIGLFHK